MMVSLFQWRAVVGIFNSRSSARSYLVCNLIKNFVPCFEILLFCWRYFQSAFIILLTLIYIHIFLQCHRDIELNQGPRKLKINSFSICHWNLNSLAAHNFSKLTQLIAYNSIYKHDFICLSETYLDSSIPDNLIDIEGYKLIRADHPDNIKSSFGGIYHPDNIKSSFGGVYHPDNIKSSFGGVCIYHKE